MPKSDRNLFQVRISEEEKLQIKTLAASQGMTLQQVSRGVCCVGGEATSRQQAHGREIERSQARAA